eukprot:122716_1
MWPFNQLKKRVSTLGDDSQSKEHQKQPYEVQHNTKIPDEKQTESNDTMSKYRQYDLDEDPDDDYNECVLDPNNDRRIIICDSQNKSDGIIQCIGSIESQYIPDSQIRQTEKTHGTGTVIHIDDSNTTYVLTAAHNVLVAEKQCKKCKTKTLKTYCPNKTCNSKFKAKKTGQLIKPTHVYFSRRSDGTQHKLGENVQRYNVIDYKLPDKYYKHSTPRGGYDICILIFKCTDKDGIVLYKTQCPNLKFIND